MRTTTLAAVALIVLASTLGSGPARATSNCVAMSTLPINITAPGVYCLAAHLTTAMTTGIAILIASNSVVLEMDGYTLDGLGGGPGTQARGIAAIGRQNITIRNGTIRGFQIGVNLTGQNSHAHVENLRVVQSTINGIEVEGLGTIIRNNHVVATGGTTMNPNASAHGILVAGIGPRVLGNDVISTVKQGSGIARGIFFTSTTGGLAVDNRVMRADVGVDFSGSTGKFRDNLTFAVTTPYVGGTNVGNNN